MRIVVGLTEHLGDIVACEPVARHLKEKHPSASLAWVVAGRYRELIDANPYIDETIVVECLTDWIKLTKHGCYDRIVDLHTNYRVCPHCCVPLYKTTGNPYVNVYEWFDYGSILEAFSVGAGLPKLSVQPQVYVQNLHKENVDRLHLGNDYCVVHRTSNDAAKDWRDAHWQELVEWLLTVKKMKVVEVGAGKRPAALPVRTDGYLSLHNATSILETAEVIRRARLFIGVDSGPAHLANAVRAPGVVLLGRYGYFRRYMPFSGHYASHANDVKIIRNLTGHVVDIPLQEVVDAIDYVLSIQECARSDTADATIPGNPKQPIGRQRLASASVASSSNASQLDVRHSDPACLGGSLSRIEQPPGDQTRGTIDYPRVFSFYLPQFHPIAENNAAHGMGFTEWNNVIRAKPLFKGHYQPRMPGELGMYDLRATEVMDEQVRLATDHGISGFCFYYYYFNGRKLLYTPINNYIRSDHKMPFFFLWANENWTERWDGGDRKVIIQQEHSKEDDRVFLEQLLPIFEDDRYVKIDGKPLLMLYKVHLFSDILRTTESWRQIIEKAGYPGIYLVMVDDWTTINHPRDFGCDATYEIPSNIVPADVCVDSLETYDLDEGFEGKIVDYYKFANFHLGRPIPAYKRFRTVMLPWDNTPRYRNQAIVHVNADNDAYKMWLISAYLDTHRRFVKDERIMFVHSWNEWCEGTYLEPDGRYGRRFLEQTRDAIRLGREVIDMTERSVLDPSPLVTMQRVEQERDAGAFRVAKFSRDEADRLRAELAAIHASTSWRVTRPLRRVKRLLRRR